MPATISVPDGVDFDGPLYATDAGPVMNRTLVISDNLPALRAMPDDCVDLIYLDPPFNSGADYLNPIGLSAAEARGLQRDLRLPVPGANEPYQTGFRDHFHMNEFNKDGTPNDNWKPEWVREISRVIPSLPPIIAAAGHSHSSSMQGYVTFMAIRLVEMRRVLKPTGSIYLHCDDTACHYLRATMDAIFGAERFIDQVTWKRSVAHNDKKGFGRISDYILLYANGDDYTWNFESALATKTRAEIRAAYPETDEVGWYRSENVTGMGAKGGESIIPWRGYDVAARGRHWAPPLRDGTYADYIEWHFIPEYKEIAGVRERLDALDEAGLIHHPREGGVWPGLKRYADADRGSPLQNIIVNPTGFTNYNSRRGRGGEYVGYKTQKPLKLIEIFIKASSNPGDVVLDPFCGCATTPIAAEGLKRRWIGMDRGVEAYRQVVNRIRKTFPDMATEGESTLIENRRFYRLEALPGQDNDAPYVSPMDQREPPEPKLELTKAQRRELLGKQDGFCLGCGTKPDMELMEGDHVVPKGVGPEDMVNFQLLCGYCNKRKRTRPMRELWSDNERDGYLVFRRRMENLYNEREDERLADPRMAAFRDFWEASPPNGNGRRKP